jgi:hypothetical protein
VERQTSVITIRRRLKAGAASRFIRSVAANHHTPGIGIKTLCTIRRRTAANTYGEGFCDVFRNGKQLGHGIERPSTIVLIEPGNDHPFPPVGHLIANVNQIETKELGFIDSDNLRLSFKPGQNLRSFYYKLRLHFHIAVADNVIFTEAVVQPGFENLYALLRNLSSSKPANQFLALSAEHAAADHFNRTEAVVRILK